MQTISLGQHTNSFIGASSNFVQIDRMIRFAVLLMFAAPLTAQTVPSALPDGSEIIRLSPAEVQSTLDEAARRNADPLTAALGNDTTVYVRDRKPHGEVGMFVGTGGARGIFGSTVVPLGENASAAFSFSTGRMPGYYGRPY